MKTFIIKGENRNEDRTDIAAEIRNMAEACNGEKSVKIILPKAEYDFIDPQAAGDFKSLMEGKLDYDTHWGKPGLPYNSAVMFENCEDLELDGQGSTVYFHGLIQPFAFIGCKNVIIRDLTIDWRRPLFSVGKILSVNISTVRVEIFPEYPVVGGEPVWAYMDYNPEAGHIGMSWEFRNMSRLRLVCPQVAEFDCKRPEQLTIGAYLILRHVGNYRPGIHILKSSRIRLENVIIHANPGMGVIGHHSSDLTFRRFKVCPRDNRLMSTNTDAAHFINCSGFIDFEDCLFKGMGDDAVNIHGFYMSILELLDDHRALVTILNENGVQDMVFDVPRIGDNVEFANTDTLYPFAEGRIASVEVDADNWRAVIGFDSHIPDSVKVGDVFANISNLAVLRFVGCTVRDIRARGVLIQTRGALVENCLFDHCTGTGVHINTATGWWESIGARDVVVRNNTFRNCGYGDGTYYEASGVAVGTECKTPAAGVHRNIRIEGNTIIGCGSAGIYIGCTDGAIVRENIFESCKEPVVIEHSKNVEVS